MNTNQALVIYETVRATMTGEMSFPQIVGRLSEIGVERYHADYSRHESTFYFADGRSLAITVPREDCPTGEVFREQDVQSAIRQSQRGEHKYTDFVRKTMAAGCVGYFVQIKGQRAIYFGRNGESHVEWFPGAKQS